MRFHFIQQQAKQNQVATMCHALGVSRSGYYAWRRRPVSSRELANQVLMKLIRLAYKGTGSSWRILSDRAPFTFEETGCPKYTINRVGNIGESIEPMTQDITVPLVCYSY